MKKLIKHFFFTNSSLGKSLTTIFYAIYTYTAIDETSIDPFHNQMTPLFGMGIFGFYHITNITILMSMLIAMLTKSFDSIMVTFNDYIKKRS